MTPDLHELHRQCRDAEQVDDEDRLRGSTEKLRLAAEAAEDDRELVWSQLFVAMIHVMAKEHDVALSLLATVRAEFERMGDQEGLALTVLGAGRVYARRDELEEAVSNLIDAYKRFLTLEDMVGVQRVQREFMNLKSWLHNIDEFQAQILRLLDGSEISSAPQIAGFLMCVLAASLMMRGEDAPKAIEYAYRSYEICEAVGDTLGCARALDALCNGHWFLGEAGKAAEFGLRAVSMAEASGYVAFTIVTLVNAAYPFIQLENYSKVLELNKRAMKLGEENGLVAGIGWAEAGIGHALLHLGDASGALQHDDRAIELMMEAGDSHGLSYALQRRGQALAALDRDDEARDSFQKCIELRKRFGSKLEIAEVQAELGRLLAKRGSISEAMVLLNESIAIAEEVSGKAVIYAVHRTLADVHAASGNIEKAFAHLMKYVEVRNEVQDQESVEKATAVEYLHQQELQRKEQEATDRILNNVLPLSVSRRLKSGQKRIADSISSASVMFVDIVGFTPIASALSADDLVELLDKIFKHFDVICAKHGVEKIKTIGDAYMAVGGAPEPCVDHAVRCARVALEIISGISGINLEFRIGLHSGELVAGVIGDSRIAYDLWGDTVNTAARMESHGVAGHIHVSDTFRSEVLRGFINEECPFHFVDRGRMGIKGKGEMQTYYLSATPVQKRH